MIILLSCKEKKIVTNICWLNNEYIDCLKNSLSCECEEKAKTYYSIVIDKNINSKNYGVALSNFNLTEPYISN